jgi:glycosyltransferase involved in cell wall biosynthesis
MMQIPNREQGLSEQTVSVVLATYKPDEHMLEEAIESVAKQTYKDIELVIIDSSGLQRLENLGDNHSWITYLYQPPSGLAAAWNMGIEAATGQFIGFLADDDFYVPTKLEVQIQHLQRGYDFVYSDIYVISQSGRVSTISALEFQNTDSSHIEYFTKGHGIPHITVVGRRRIFKQEQFDESLIVREDPHLWVRLLKRHHASRINQPLAYKRRRPESVTGNPDIVYQSELHEISSLCNRFPELEAYRARRTQWAEYRYAKGLMRLDRTHEARTVLTTLLSLRGVKIRFVGVYLSTLLPFHGNTALSTLEYLYEKVLNIRKKYL